jgi:hypothetical protein
MKIFPMVNGRRCLGYPSQPAVTMVIISVIAISHVGFLVMVGPTLFGCDRPTLFPCTWRWIFLSGY